MLKNIYSIKSASSALCLGYSSLQRQHASVQCIQRTISTTATLYAEPPRKKRRVDPAVLRTRVEKKIKKYEREIVKMESEPRQLIPILEYQLTNSEKRDLQARPRHTKEEFGLTDGTIKAANRLWAFYRSEQSRLESESIRRIEAAQTIALKRLEKFDKELYDETIAVDDISMIPYRSSHVRKETAPNPSYSPPDGYIKDVTKEWVM